MNETREKEETDERKVKAETRDERRPASSTLAAPGSARCHSSNSRRMATRIEKLKKELC